MTDTPQGTGPEDNPSEFDISALETGAQRELRAQYEFMTTVNADAIASFDPDGAVPVLDLYIDPVDEGLKNAEPLLSEMLKTNMLASILGKEDPLLLADQELSESYTAFTSHSIDGRNVTLMTVFDRDEVVVACLVTNKIAAAEIELQSKLDADHENRIRIKREFNLTEGFIEQSGLDADDIADMLKAYDAIQELETTRPDLAKLEKLRHKLTKVMLPRTDIMQGKADRKLPTATEAYRTEVERIISENHLTGEDKTALLQSERLLRLSDVSKQLRQRNQIRTAGRVSLVGSATTVGAIGAEMAYLYGYGSPVANAIVGGGVGLAAGVEMTHTNSKMRKQAMAYQNDYYRHESYSRAAMSQRLDGMLAEETKQARTMVSFTNFR